MFYRRFLGLAALLLLISACGTHPAPQRTRRVALLPFENLTSDASLAWMSYAIPSIAAYQLGPRVATVEVPDPRAAVAAQPTEEISGYFVRRDGNVEIHAAVRDPLAQKTLQSHVVADADVLKAVDALARRLAPQVRPYTTQNVPAISAYFRAATTADRAQVDAALSEATAADPRFAAAHLARVQSALARGDKESAQKAIEDARGQAAAFSETDRAKLDLLASQIHGDARTRVAALSKLTEADPASGEYWRAYGQSALAIHDYSRAVKAFEALTKLNPQSVADWNSLGYARAYNGDLNGALKAIEEYRRLAPNDANALDSLGEVHFYLRNFREAAEYFEQAHKKKPDTLQGGELFRAAFALHAAGDSPAADKLFAQFVSLRNELKDPLVGVRQSVWLYITGRKDQALAASGLPQSQRCLWLLDAGKQEEARQLATSLRGDLCAALTQPIKDAAGWRALFEKAVPNVQLRSELTAFALVLNGFPQAAHPIFEELAKERPVDTASEARIMAAATKPGSPTPRVLPPRSPDPGLGSIVWSRFR